MVPCLLVTDWHADSGQKIKKSPMSIFALKNPLYPKIVLILVVILTTPIFFIFKFLLGFSNYNVNRNRGFVDSYSFKLKLYLNRVMSYQKSLIKSFKDGFTLAIVFFFHVFDVNREKCMKVSVKRGFSKSDSRHFCQQNMSSF